MPQERERCPERDIENTGEEENLSRGMGESFRLRGECGRSSGEAFFFISTVCNCLPHLSHYNPAIGRKHLGKIKTSDRILSFWPPSVFTASPHIYQPRVLFSARRQPSAQLCRAGTSLNAEKNSSISVKEMRRKSQKDKCSQVLKNTSPEIKLN